MGRARWEGQDWDLSRAFWVDCFSLLLDRRVDWQTCIHECNKVKTRLVSHDVKLSSGQGIQPSDRPAGCKVGREFYQRENPCFCLGGKRRASAYLLKMTEVRMNILPPSRKWGSKLLPLDVPKWIALHLRDSRREYKELGSINQSPFFSLLSKQELAPI